MAFLNALADVLRPHSTVPATGPASLAADTTDTAISTGAREGGPPLAAGTPGTSSPMTEAEREPSKREKTLMPHLSKVSHGVNHFQNQMMTMLYLTLWPSWG